MLSSLFTSRSLYITLKKMISTSEWHAKHLFAGQNTEHILVSSPNFSLFLTIGNSLVSFSFYCFLKLKCLRSHHTPRFRGTNYFIGYLIFKCFSYQLALVNWFRFQKESYKNNIYFCSNGHKFLGPTKSWIVLELYDMSIWM